MELFPHQERGADFLAEATGTRGLFFGMGTGKTLTALEAFKRVPADRLLVIVPPIAAPMWVREIRSYTGLTAQFLKTGTSAVFEGAQALVVTYTIATKRAAELREWISGGVVICDESHALKDVKAQRTKAVLGRGGIVSGAEYSWMLTGTPITRWNDDVYPFLARADLDGLRDRVGGDGNVVRFRLRYTIQQKRQWSRHSRPVDVTVGNRNTIELAEWIYGGGHALRVDLKEVFENMPPLTINRYDVKPKVSPETRMALKALEKTSVSEIRRQLERKEPALATLRRELGVGKVHAAAQEIRERVESGQSVLVGAWHTSVIDALHDALKGLSRGVIDGRTSAKNKATCEQEWNAGNVDVLICQIAAAGVSLNLQQGGSQIVVVEEDWSPAIMDQFYARLWRYGQKRHVHVDILTTDTKLDQAIGRISNTKDREHGRFNSIGRHLAAE